jgi:hypothetical protein
MSRCNCDIVIADDCAGQLKSLDKVIYLNGIMEYICASMIKHVYSVDIQIIDMPINKRNEDDRRTILNKVREISFKSMILYQRDSPVKIQMYLGYITI